MKKWSDCKSVRWQADIIGRTKKKMLSLLEKDSNARVLDIGCASGEFTLKVGCDWDEEVVRHGHR